MFTTTNKQKDMFIETQVSNLQTLKKLPRVDQAFQLGELQLQDLCLILYTGL